MKELPEDPKIFMSQWLQDRKAGKAPASRPSKEDPEEAQEIRKSMRRSITEAFVPPPRDAPSLVRERWERAHEGEEDASKRVTLEKLLEVVQAEDAAHKAFVEALFSASVGLMLPNKKTDLGKHCFGYATLLNDEYKPGSCPSDGLGLLGDRPLPDALRTVREELRADFAAATSGCDRVTKEAFVTVLFAKHKAKLRSEGPSEEDLKEFLGRVFDAVALLGGGAAQDLDRHAFTYGAYFAYEFYFKDVPVADLFGITKAA